MISGGVFARYMPILVLAGAIALTAFAGCQGYRMGYGKAEAEGQAIVAEVRQEYAQAIAKSERAARERLQAEMARADAVAVELTAAKSAHSADIKTLKARIANVTLNSTHIFSVEFVRVYNAAIGADPGYLHSAGGASGAEGRTSSGATADTGLLDADSGVSEADILAHIADYGQRCRDIEAQLRGWIDLSRSWEARHEP